VAAGTFVSVVCFSCYCGCRNNLACCLLALKACRLNFVVSADLIIPQTYRMQCMHGAVDEVFWFISIDVCAAQQRSSWLSFFRSHTPQESISCNVCFQVNVSRKGTNRGIHKRHAHVLPPSAYYPAAPPPRPLLEKRIASTPFACTVGLTIDIDWIRRFEPP